MRHKGALTPGASGMLRWGRDDRDAVASADFRTDAAELILSYDAHDGIEAPKVIEHRVALSFVRPRSAARVHTSSVPVRTAAGASQCSISAEAYSAVGSVTVLLMRAKAKM